MANPEVNGEKPSVIFSLLDTDLYKLTMQCAVLKYFPNTSVAYRFTNRTPHMKLTKRAVDWLHVQILQLANITVTSEEIEWLKKTCPYFSKEYLSYLEAFKMKPEQHVELIFKPEQEGQDDSPGELQITVHGLWIETILYEIPLLALISEAYFKFVDRDWTYTQQEESAKRKGLKLPEGGCVFSEFGSRRRRSYKTHELIMQGLASAQQEATAEHPDWKGKFTGTSNVHMAMRFGVQPVGTVAHEWFMGIAAIEDNYADANETAMKYWIGTFGPGVLGIALTDTFGTKAFLKAFAKAGGEGKTYAQIFNGVRQDSGDPMAFLPVIKKFYDEQGVKEKKTIVFSDSLNVDKCIRYKEATDAAGLTPSFGVGTFFTNDFHRASKPEEKSVPLNIVIKLSEAGGRKTIKLSDDVGKNMGDDELVKRIKREVGYEDKAWSGGDEAHRWDK